MHMGKGIDCSNGEISSIDFSDFIRAKETDSRRNYHYHDAVHVKDTKRKQDEAIHHELVML